MFAIIGVVVVFGAIIGGYLMEHGKLAVLVQPAELVIIGGAALGTVLIANPLVIVKKMFAALMALLKPSKFTQSYYLETLKLLFELFAYIRKEGMAKIEVDVESPAQSPVFSKFPSFLANHHAVHFVCDTLRMSSTGSVNLHELDQMLDADIEVHHHEGSAPVKALNNVADSLPGLGIVAAVLGVVITMGALGGPPEEIGHKVAAALVGTFLGILLCYGLLGPLASSMSKMNDAESDYYRCLRAGIIAFLKGSAPILAVEFARRMVPHSVRPTFKAMESACKNKG